MKRWCRTTTGTSSRRLTNSLKSAGLPALDHDSVEFARLCRRLLVAREEYIQVERERWNGHYRPVTHAAGAAASAAAASSKGKTPVAPAGPRFTEVVAEVLRGECPIARTDVQVRAELDRFVEAIGGDKPIGSIVKADCRAYKDYMMQTRKLGPATIIKHLSNLSGIFKWCEGPRISSQRAAIPFAVSHRTRRRRRRRHRIGDRSPMKNCSRYSARGTIISQRESNPARYWLPLMCLFRVCRRRKLVNSRSVTFKKRGDPFIRINDDEKLGQTLKNEGSRRRVPHPFVPGQAWTS